MFNARVHAHAANKDAVATGCSRSERVGVRCWVVLHKDTICLCKDCPCTDSGNRSFEFNVHRLRVTDFNWDAHCCRTDAQLWQVQDLAALTYHFLFLFRGAVLQEGINRGNWAEDNGVRING